MCRSACMERWNCRCYSFAEPYKDPLMCKRPGRGQCIVYLGASEPVQTSTNEREVQLFESFVPPIFSVPRTFLSYAPSRGASTLQYQVLCAAMYLLHADAPENVDCYFWSGIQSQTLSTSHSKYSVVKTHIMPQNQDALRKHAWLFTTYLNSSQTESIGQHALARQMSMDLRYEVKYVQDYASLGRLGYRVVYAYQPVLHLTDEQTAEIMQYIRYWSVLRQCCGSQMSHDWRAQLQGNKKHAARVQPQSTLYPACEIYDLDALETALMHSSLYQRFADRAPVLRSLSSMDGDFTGKYCSTTNQRIQDEKLPFNFNFNADYNQSCKNCGTAPLGRARLKRIMDKIYANRG